MTIPGRAQICAMRTFSIEARVLSPQVAVVNQIVCQQSSATDRHVLMELQKTPHQAEKENVFI